MTSTWKRSLWVAALALATQGCTRGHARRSERSPAESCAGGAQCGGPLGLCAPIPTCAAAGPCRGLAGKRITTAIDLPRCASSSGKRDSFSDGPPLLWTDDVTGEQRAACVFTPARGKAPLLVFLPGSHGTADSVYDATSLRAKAAARGFVLASVQARNLAWPGLNPPGTELDYLYRDLASPSRNPDVRSLDHLIDALVERGHVDRHRIYVVGWSNGAEFAALYALGRHATATPGGNRVAAAVSYAGADPFLSYVTDGGPACASALPSPHGTPILFVHRACDALVACDAAHLGPKVPPGADVADFVAALRRAGDGQVQELIVDGRGDQVTACASLCPRAVGLVNHLRWPDGVADGGGKDWEPAMLQFLDGHARP